jgi:hypothetical protein
MKQMSLKLNMYVRSINVINNNFEKFILNTIFYFFGILMLFYILILGNMVKNIVERQGLEASLRSLSTEVQGLEVAYLSMSNNIDLALSHSLGFKETQATFATRKALGFLSTSKPASSVKTVSNDL